MLLGTLIGVLPGIGPVATISMLLPITHGIEPTGALIMLAGIYYGAQYGGSTTSILVNLPGEASSVVTCIDGYQMARQGRAGAALAIAAIASFYAGTIATVLCAVMAAPLARIASKFGPAEYFSLMVLGLIGAVLLANKSVARAIGMVVFGLILGHRRARSPTAARCASTSASTISTTASASSGSRSAYSPSRRSSAISTCPSGARCSPRRCPA